MLLRILFNIIKNVKYINIKVIKFIDMIKNNVEI